MSQILTLHTFDATSLQAVPLTTAAKVDAGSTSGTGGVWTGIYLVTCTADGSLDITFPDGTTKTKVFTEGMVRAFPNGATIDIVSGTFDLV